MASLEGTRTPDGRRLSDAERREVRGFVQEVLELRDDDDLDESANLAEEYEAESLDRMEILARVEYRFAITFNRKDVDEVKTVEDLFRVTEIRLKDKDVEARP